jgi:hypothetical protein
VSQNFIARPPSWRVERTPGPGRARIPPTGALAEVAAAFEADAVALVLDPAAGSHRVPPRGTAIGALSVV